MHNCKERNVIFNRLANGPTGLCFTPKSYYGMMCLSRCVRTSVLACVRFPQKFLQPNIFIESTSNLDIVCMTSNKFEFHENHIQYGRQLGHFEFCQCASDFLFVFGHSTVNNICPIDFNLGYHGIDNYPLSEFEFLTN